MGEVLGFSGETEADIPSSVILSAALDSNINDAIVIGSAQDGTLYIATAPGELARIVWLIELAKHRLMREYET